VVASACVAEVLRGSQSVTEIMAALSAITAAVVGVIAFGLLFLLV
jgi:hypothetical protein